MATVEAETQLLHSPEADLDLPTTKLARPRVPPTYVARPHLDRLLDAGARRPLTVVSAGPGWGKTLAAAHWAASEPEIEHVAWISLDRSDNDPRRFWSLFVAALRTAGAVPPTNTLAPLVPVLGSEEEFLRRLLVGLTQLPESVAVVLDDFHLIDEPRILNGVTELLRHRLDMLRLVVLTRADPTLPLHRMRVAEDLAEIRPRDLAFNAAGAGALLEAHGVTVGNDEAHLLISRTEGWPAGLRLAALFLAREEPRRHASDFVGNDQAVTSYLAEEVLGSQPPDLRRFLLRTSIAERLTSGLAEVLTGQDHCQQHLETLESTNAFVVGLGPGREWFRYHALLREMLHHRLKVDEPEVLPDLHRRAARWFAEEGHPIDALHHAADAEDWSLVGDLVVTQAFPLLVSLERTALDRVLARVPVHLLDGGAEMALCAAARAFHAGRFADLEPHLEVAEGHLASTDPRSRTGTRVALLLMRMAVARSRGDITSVIDDASEALDTLSASGSTLPAAEAYRAIALGNLGTGLLWSGQIETAEARLDEGLVAAESARIEVAQINMLGHLGLAATLSGRLSDGFGYATRAVELVESRGWAPLLQAAPAYLSLAVIHLQRNNVAEAQGMLAQGRAAAARERASRFALDLAQARLDASIGRPDVARERLQALRSELGGWQPPTFLARWQAITEAETDLAAGDPVAAATRIEFPADKEPPHARERVCLARALLDGGDARRADDLLAPLRIGPVHEDVLAEAWLLTALAADALREDNRAVEALGRALEAAGSEEIRRPFVLLDDGRLPRLLARLAEVEPRFVVQAEDLAAFLRDEGRDRVPSSYLPEPLTDRELMVLRFLPTMMTNAEIASELYVSINTVKAHLKHIFRKLDVESRRQAVHRARELGLLVGPDPATSR